MWVSGGIPQRTGFQDSVGKATEIIIINKKRIANSLKYHCYVSIWESNLLGIPPVNWIPRFCWCLQQRLLLLTKKE